ncbi:MAG: KpsF/GutQ family sugar-phosphate isomerase [Candidatus Omnitrophica bacterium]|nr:KpsF/GutQ family sugar-phosphate isomerase [Candidatus Omnitrophota bacterium]
MSLKKAKEVLLIESEALSALAKRLDQNFIKAVDLIFKCNGRVIISGIGKAGIVGTKIAATFSSTGTPSISMHSADAVHGDLGQVTKNDILILISNSGETEETKRIIPTIKKIGASIIAMTGNAKSNLAKYSDVVLDISVKKEGCPLGLAPMASTTAMMACGDALAACLIERRGFKKEEFALYHPAGSLGRKLLLKVEDIMRKGGQFPKVKENASVKNVLLTITKARCGSACVLNEKGRFIGIFTDGDLRRHIESDPRLLDRQVKDVMTKNPTTIVKDKLAVEALQLLKDKKIDEIPVIDSKSKLVGLLDIQDLLKVGLL